MLSDLWQEPTGPSRPKTLALCAMCCTAYRACHCWLLVGKPS